MIDWTKPLELMDGTPVRLRARGGLDGKNPDTGGDYWIEGANGERLETRCVSNEGLGRYDQLYVRNRLVSPPATDNAVEKEPTETLRDRFAMAALTGLLAADASPLAFSLASRHAWLMADKMMAERGS